MGIYDLRFAIDDWRLLICDLSTGQSFEKTFFQREFRGFGEYPGGYDVTRMFLKKRIREICSIRVTPALAPGASVRVKVFGFVR